MEVPMTTQYSTMLQQCWENAFASPREYRVPVDSVQRAIAFRAQCHKYRRKMAEKIYGPDFDQYYLYDLEISIEGLTVVFRRRSRVVLPPIESVVVPKLGMWCVMIEGEGFVVEQRSLPIQD